MYRAIVVATKESMMLAFHDPVIARDVLKRDQSSAVQRFADRDVLITGATGMLASYVASAIWSIRRKYSIKGRRLILTSRRPIRASGRYGLPSDVEAVSHEAAIETSARLDQAVVLHAASPAAPEQYIRDPLGCMAVNTAMTLALGTAMESTKSCLMFVSSGEVYGPRPATPTRESDYSPFDPTQPRSVYAEAKRAGEAIVLGFHRSQGLDVRVARLFHTFGPGVRLDDGRVFGGLIRSAVLGNDFALRTSGSARRAFLYSYDLVEGLAHLYAELDAGTVANVAGDEGSPIRDVSELAMSSMADGRYQFLSDTLDKFRAGVPEPPSADIVADTTLLRLTGWRPQFGLQEAFRATYDSALWRQGIRDDAPS